MTASAADVLHPVESSLSRVRTRGTCMPAPGKAVSRQAEFADAIADIFAREFKLPGMDPETSFFDAGGDSLMAENVVLGINARFGLKLPTAVLLEASSPAELALIVDGMVSGHPSGKLVVRVSGGRGAP